MSDTELVSKIEALEKRIRKLEAKEFAVLQITAAAPAHVAAEGVFCWDATNNVMYVNNNGAAAWTNLN